MELPSLVPQIAMPQIAYQTISAIIPQRMEDKQEINLKDFIKIQTPLR